MLPCLLVGDKDQLPSVGAGQVLSDIIGSEGITVVALTEVFRQSQQSNIIVNAHRINQGLLPITQQHPAAANSAQANTVNSSNSQNNDFFFIKCDEPENIAQQIIGHSRKDWLKLQASIEVKLCNMSCEYLVF